MLKVVNDAAPCACRKCRVTAGSTGTDHTKIGAACLVAGNDGNGGPHRALHEHLQRQRPVGLTERDQPPTCVRLNNVSSTCS